MRIPRLRGSPPPVRADGNPLRRPFVALLVGAVLGGLLGALLPQWPTFRFSPPIRPARTEWTLVVPNLEISFGDLPANTPPEGSGVVNGNLYIAAGAFGRGDVARPIVERPVARVVVALAQRSGPVQIRFPANETLGASEVSVSPDGWWQRGESVPRPFSTADAVTIETRQGLLYVDGVRAGSAKAGQIEIAASEPAALIRKIGFFDETGNLLRQDNFFERPAQWPDRAFGAAIGLIIMVGTIFLVRTAGSVAAAAPVWTLATAPLLMAFVPHYPMWARIREHTFATDSSPSNLRNSAIATGLGVFVLTTLVATRLLRLPTTTSRDIPLAGAAAVLVGVALVASLHLPTSGLVWLIPGLLLLAMPVWASHRLGLPLLPTIIRDTPALFAVAVLGWGPGCGLAWLWRLTTLLSDVPMLLARNPRVGTDFAVLLALCLPLVAEAGVRSTSLGTSWSAESLRGATLDDVAGKGNSIGAFWHGTCRRQKTQPAVYYFGGSSTGGSFQLSGHPEWAWPARIHEQLCADSSLPNGLRSLNYGDSGRDSFDVAHVAAALFAETPPAVAVFYGGINDILTESSSLTRKQRAQLNLEQPATFGAVAYLARTSRVFSGMSLLFRPAAGSKSAVPAVPLADAEENLRTLAAATTAAGGQLVLIPELASFELDRAMSPYWQMESRLAEELPGVTLVNLYEMMPTGERDAALADRNHLTREGSDHVAQLIAPTIARFLAKPP